MIKRFASLLLVALFALSVPALADGDHDMEGCWEIFSPLSMELQNNTLWLMYDSDIVGLKHPALTPDNMTPEAWAVIEFMLLFHNTYKPVVLHPDFPQEWILWPDLSTPQGVSLWRCANGEVVEMVDHP